MKLNAKNLVLFMLVGSLLSYTITLNDLQAGSMLVGAITGALALYSSALQDKLDG